jgi:septal ring factor EnvC (AmiA/AmiB activator)
LKSRKHTTRLEHNSSLCSCACGKSYTHKNSLEYHKKSCDYKGKFVPKAPPAVEKTPLEAMQIKLDIYEKERDVQNARIETMQRQIDNQNKEQKEIKNKITALEHNANNSNTQCLITHPLPQKSRDKRKK